MAGIFGDSQDRYSQIKEITYGEGPVHSDNTDANKKDNCTGNLSARRIWSEMLRSSIMHQLTLRLVPHLRSPGTLKIHSGHLLVSCLFFCSAIEAVKVSVEKLLPKSDNDDAERAATLYRAPLPYLPPIDRVSKLAEDYYPTPDSTPDSGEDDSSPHAPAPPRPSRPAQRDGSNINVPHYRPAAIEELGKLAGIDHWDPSKSVKHWLKAGESHRRTGKAYVAAHNLESAFVEYGKAATIVIEKLPSHPEYFTKLSIEQRHNLGLVGLPFFKDRCISQTDY
jgi:hypothetical protein